jgi:hypothetical protein
MGDDVNAKRTYQTLHDERGRPYRFETYLGGNICNRGWRDLRHSVNSSIARACRLGLSVYRTGQHKDVLVSLLRVDD